MRPVALAVRRDRRSTRSRCLRRAAELGLTCYDLPAEYGGGGFESLRDRCEVIEELAWGDSPIFWVIAQGGFFAGPLLALGSDEQKQRWLPPLCGAEPPACSVAITEPEHGSDAAAIEATAVRRDGGYVLNGRKKFIGNGHIADLCIVFATVEPGSRSRGITAFLVEKDDDGFVRGPRLPKMGSRCFPAAEVAFEDCFVPEDRRLGEEGAGFRGLMWVFDVARVQLAAGAVGLGRAALELAVDYAKEREAFGRPIHEYQAVSFRLADAKLKLDQARLMTHRAAELVRRGRAVLDRGGDGQARGVGGVRLRDLRRRDDARRRRLHPRLARPEVVPRREARRDLGRDERHHAPPDRAEPVRLMARDPRYDVLFEPVQLGPVTARNRFFQVPHCNGMGHRDPTAHAVMRGVKAEGGWAVVCTEEVEIHPTSDVGGYIEGRLWDDADIPAHERLVEQVHAHGSLAGIELVPQRHGRRELLRPDPAARPVAPAGHRPTSRRRRGR